MCIYNYLDKRRLEWTEECTCNSGKPSFDAIEFRTNSSRMEIVCSKCHGMICWWPISTEQIASTSARGTTKSSSILTRIR